MKTQDHELNLPWYRVGMVWLAIALPAIVVVASISTVIIAHKNAPLLYDATIQEQPAR